MALHFAPEAAGFVGFVANRTKRGKRRGLGEQWVAGENENQTGFFAACIRARAEHERTPFGKRSRPRYGTSVQRPVQS